MAKPDKSEELAYVIARFGVGAVIAYVVWLSMQPKKASV